MTEHPADVQVVERPPDPAWSPLVERIRRGDPEGMEELYAVFAKGVRYFLWRQMGSQDLDDKVHDVFLIITQAIQRGDLREPERLMGYVRTVLRRQVASYIETAVDAVIAANPDKVEAVKAKPAMLGWFVGQVMKSTGGKANPQAVNELLKKKLGV